MWFQLEKLDGGAVSLDDYRGMMNAILVFWHPYSATGKVVINQLDRFYSLENRKKYNFVILSVCSIYGPNQLDEYRRIKDKTESEIVFLVDDGSTLGELYGVEKIPSIFLIGKDGIIVDVIDGTPRQLERRLSVFLGSMEQADLNNEAKSESSE